MTAENNETAKNLLNLGVGEGSKVEQIKANSHYLRGEIAEELQNDSSHVSEAQIQLLKFHGTYQQEDRDQRQARKSAGQEKAYQFMVRSRIPGGALTAEQYLIHDEIATKYGSGTLRITTRQSFQLHGILKGNLRNTIHDINESLLSTLSACGDVNRNVLACPAPTSDRAHAQVQEIAHQIAMRLAPRSKAYYELWIDGEKVQTIEDPEEVEPLYGATYLPRKFKVAVAFPGDNCIDVYTNDVGLVANMDGETLTGFTVAIGGGMGATHGKPETHPLLAQPFCNVTVEQVLPVVETIVSVQRDYGDRQNRKHARMKYVVEERGIQWFRNEVEQRLGYTLADAQPVEFHDCEDHLGWHSQGDGRWFVGLSIENGRIHDSERRQLKTGLHQVIEQFRPGIRLTTQQDMLLIDIAAEQRPAIEAALQEYGISTNPKDAGAYRFAMACPALPTCGLAVAEAERVLPDIVRQIEADMYEIGLGGEPLGIRMTGCPNGCARPYVGDIGFVGRSKGLYNVSVGGDRLNTRLNAVYAQSVRIENLAATIKPLLILWRDERLDQESFGDYCHRVGFAYLQAKTVQSETMASDQAKTTHDESITTGQSQD
ncbi:MAG TPA: NADPH-dependent assimilatory sulfite reductase hemoprotein subunit [Ktedonobacteraceae bacterium]|jgi:sulfite reductase (ferredoxin)|nr:NADPH-dependent assimilatory sulfite reductase hemoprotein subunit [Ktedonobacteraceae bacterium]